MSNPNTMALLATLARQYGHTRFDVRNLAYPGMTHDEVMAALQDLETQGYLHLPEGATCWLNSAGIRLADPWGEKPKVAAGTPLYALYHVNVKTGEKVRWPEEHYPAGSRDTIERQAHELRRVDAVTADNSGWTTQAHPEEGEVQVTAAVTYIPSEDDVDPDTLAEGKGKQDIAARDQRDDNAGDRGGIHTSALEPKPFRAESPRRPTREEIRSRANDHVGYGWTKRPGSWDPNINWTPEDVATYSQDYDELLAKAREANPPNFSAGHIRDFGAGAPKVTAPKQAKIAAVRDVKANSLIVTCDGQKIAHWEGATLQAALEDGTLNPRQVEASAIDYARLHGLLD